MREVEALEVTQDKAAVNEVAVNEITRDKTAVNEVAVIEAEVTTDTIDQNVIRAPADMKIRKKLITSIKVTLDFLIEEVRSLKAQSLQQSWQ
ncbi:10874_t:CDS:2 [Funneliformis caledonium]|uniref:10874_t:CDS:1 n=1 Tax=Funneliformis caledonium TaxID=1117310 RepID=A0A9N9FF22_9GLOM|nr:10874_t:CDS:2 [Funneliformis caledonium]